MWLAFSMFVSRKNWLTFFIFIYFSIFIYNELDRWSGALYALNEVERKAREFLINNCLILLCFFASGAHLDVEKKIWYTVNSLL